MSEPSKTPPPPSDDPLPAGSPRPDDESPPDATDLRMADVLRSSSTSNSQLRAELHRWYGPAGLSDGYRTRAATGARDSMVSFSFVLLHRGPRWTANVASGVKKVLRRHAEHVGLNSNFTILDTDDQIRLLKQVMEAERIDTKRWTPPSLMGVIQRWKDRGLTPERITAAEDTDFANGKARVLYAAYSVTQPGSRSISPLRT